VVVIEAGDERDGKFAKDMKRSRPDRGAHRKKIVLDESGRESVSLQKLLDGFPTAVVDRQPREFAEPAKIQQHAKKAGIENIASLCEQAV
jgi:hypothetical protein